MDGRDYSDGSGINKIASTEDLHVQDVLRAAQEELRQLVRQRADTVKRIGTIKQTIMGLANLFGDELLSDELQALIGRKRTGRQGDFTKACRIVLMEAPRPLAVREVHQQIQQKYPSMLLRHKDPTLSITTVLTRLVRYGEVQIVVGAGRRREWQWVADPSDSFLNPDVDPISKLCCTEFVEVY
jgi:hypothetical protein